MEEGEAIQENIAELKNKAPLTKEQFESWLPETLLGLPKTSSTINMIPGLGSCSSTYSVGNKKIRVMVIDGAGERGASAVASYRMSSTMEYDKQGTWGQTKTKMINGYKVKESYLKDERYNLSLLFDNRFAVDIESKEVKGEDLEQILKELNLEELK